jgi:tetratricopeptide (TPR) repeat protein/tRNA A-37 threonylcarbamoyl transferase component Bud32
MAQAPGTVLDRYKLLEQIGEGGMGTVWMADQTEPIQRRVAVKVVKEGMDTKQVLTRFEAERQALALMEHPNIARVLDAGKTPSGRPYFVMELVKGQPITKYCDEKRLRVRERLELFADVCRAVQHAHQKGVIHRDLKPSNVLVAPYDGRPVVKVIDFGVAKATGRRLTEHTLFTGFGAVVGTPEYMSPEQAEVNNQDIDTRSDVYSLGVLLYELLTGSTPLTRKRAKEAALVEVLRVIREEEPPRPSTRLAESKDTLPSISAQRQTEPAKLTRLVRGDLDWIVMKALDKDRNRRYETANAFAMDVQRYLADEPVQACPPSAGYRLRKFVRRNKGPVLAVTGFVMLLAAGTAGTTAGLLRTLAAERRALMERDEKEDARRQTRRALNTLTDEVLHELLGRQVQLTEQHRKFLQKILAYHETFAAARADDPEGREGRADGYDRVAEIRHRLGDLKDAESAYEEALALRRQLAADVPEVPDRQNALAGTLTDLGSLLRDTGRPEQAEVAYREAVAIGKRLAAELPKQPDFRQSLALSDYNLALLLHRTGRSEAAESAWRDALRLWKQLADEFPNRADFEHSLAKCHVSLSNLLTETGRLPEAESAWRQALATWKQLVAEFPKRSEFRQGLAEAHNGLGTLLRFTGRSEQGEAAYREALAIQKDLAAEFPSRPDLRQELAGTSYNLAVLLHTTHRTPEAEVLWRYALSLRRQLASDFPRVPDYQHELASTLSAFATLLRATNRAGEAEAAYTEALAIGKRLVARFPRRPEFRENLALSQNNLGFLLYQLHRAGEAETVWRSALALWKRLAVEFPKRPDVRREQARTHYNLGLLLSDKRPKEAETAFRDALALQKQLVQAFPKVPDYQVGAAGTLTSLGFLLYRNNRRPEAEAAYRHALGFQERLAAAFPKVADFQNELAGTLTKVAILCRQRRAFAAAVQLLEQARPHHKAALGASSGNAAYRQSYHNNVQLLAANSLALADHARLASAADELAHFAYDPVPDTYNAACYLSRCVALAGKNAQLAEHGRRELAHGYADRAVALLRQAVARGYKDAAHMRDDPDLQPLRGREDFKKLAAEVEAAGGIK